MKENDAFKLICPKMNRVNGDGNDIVVTCFGSGCVAWEWKTIQNPKYDFMKLGHGQPPRLIPSTTEGYCMALIDVITVES